MLEDNVYFEAHGAARRVDGSNFLLNILGEQYLVDCGEFYDEQLKRAPFAYDPAKISSLLLTHGHFDHMGRIGKLYDGGFRGPIISTEGTADITLLQMQQTVSGMYIHNQWAKGKRYTSGPKKGKYIEFQDASKARKELEAIKKQLMSATEGQLGVPYNSTIRLSENASVTFYEAGHIPGSAQLLLDINKHGRSIKLLTCVDLGRTDYQTTSHPIAADIPIVRFPAKNLAGIPDYILIECTYGDKVHGSLEDSIDGLVNAANEALKRGGKLILPAFSIMRTQMIDTFLYRLVKEGRLPKDAKIYQSSPTAERVWSLIFKHYPDLDELGQKEFADRTNNPSKFPNLVKHDKMGKTLDLLLSGETGYIIIASSGMGDRGRMRTILKHTVGDEKNIILCTGHASMGSPMYHLLHGAEELDFGDGPIAVRAETRRIGGYSGHADGEECLAHVKAVTRGKKAKAIILVHGEPEACEAARKRYVAANIAEKVIVPEKGERIVLE